MSTKNKSLILIGLLIVSIGGAFVFLQTQKGQILVYKVGEVRDEVEYKLKTEENIINVNENSAEKNDSKPINDPSTPLRDRLNVDDQLKMVDDSKEVIAEELILPTEFKLDVAFVSQAPYVDWGLPYQEACEEASAIIADKYFKNEKLDAHIMDAEIKKLVAWEKETFGYYEHTTVKEVAQIVTDYFGLTAEVVDNPSVDDLKRELYAGKLILIPAAGRELGNPYFSGEGPIYHMLVLIGWKGDRWITNDPGTRHGEGFTYSFEKLMSAIHDSPVEGEEVLTQELILTGGKRVVVVE